MVDTWHVAHVALPNSALRAYLGPAWGATKATWEWGDVEKLGSLSSLHSKKTHCVTHVCNTDLGVYIEYTVCYTVPTHCVTHCTVCYTVIENREVILQYTLELTIN